MGASSAGSLRSTRPGESLGAGNQRLMTVPNKRVNLLAFALEAKGKDVDVITS
jgi:hypothetical protein